MNNLNKYSNKYKKYAFRKIGKFFGSCAVATVITLSGAAIMAPNVAVYASSTDADGGSNDIHNLGTSDSGYEVIIPKGKKYIRNDEIESHEPVLKVEGYNGRSFIVPSENSVAEYPLSELFKKLYDKDGDGEIDDKYKDPKYPHVVDSGLTDDSEDSNNKPGVWEYNPDGKYKESDGVIDESDTIVVARKPFTINEDAEDNVVNDDGSVVLTGDYKIHVNEGDHIEAKDDVYEVGTKPKVEETPIPFTTRYEKDNDSPKGKETEVTPGVDGKTVTTTTYEVDPNTGKITENPSTSETTDPVTRVVKIGAQPKVEETPIPFTTRYEKDNDSPKGKETEVTPGVDGKTVTTTTYEVDPNTGKITENPSTPVTTDPVTRVVKVGTQPKVEETPIPFTIRYEKDDESPKGKETEVTPGVPGKTVTTTTYTVDPNTGKVTENPSTPVTTDPVTRVVKVGTQPKVEETPIPFTIRYEKDDESPKGKETEVTPGVPGKTVTTTTYTVDPNTGKVTENPSTSVTTDPTTRVVKVGAQPKVEKTPIPFETRYEDDNSIPEGEEREVTAGVNGETVKTTTYEINPDTGVVTENDPTTKTTDAVTRVVKRGTKPKVEETPKNPQPEQPVEETPKNPQPEQPVEETPKNPQPEQPGEGTPENPQPEQPGEGTPENPQPEQPGEETPENPQPEQPGEGTPENPQPKQPGEGTTNGDKATDKPTEGTPSSDKPTDKPTEGTPSGDKPTDKPTEGTPSSPESSTSHSTTPSSSSSTSTPEKPSKAETPAVRTVWRDENGKDLKVPSDDKQEAGEFEGYEFVESHREGDNVTVHVFRAKKTATNTPNEKTTQPEEKQVAVATVTSDKKEETLSSPTSEKVELPNTGTVTNGFFTAEVAAILAGLGILIPGVKKKETEE